MSCPVAVVIPGHPVVTALQQEGERAWSLCLPSGVVPAEVCVFLTQPISRADIGVAVYWTAEPFQDLEFLCALSDSRPSDVVSTGWPLNPDVQGKGLKLGVAIEPAAEIQTKVETAKQTAVDFRETFARKVALNLFKFIESFLPSGSSQSSEVLDRWFRRFQAKYRVDPLFIMKTEE